MVLAEDQPDSLQLLEVVDNCAHALVSIVEAIASLSCEVIGANPKAFEALSPLGESAMKDEVDVARDMNFLLFGSKFVGRRCDDAIATIPEVHGSFRTTARSLHARARAQLKSARAGKGKALTPIGLALATAAHELASISYGRAILVIGTLGVELQKLINDLFKLNCTQRIQEIEAGFCSLTIKISSKQDSSVLLREVNLLLNNLRSVLAWEAALGLFALQLNDESAVVDSLDKNDLEQVGKMGKKGKKKMALGKGTAVIRDFLKDKVMDECGNAHDPDVLHKWVSRLCSLFLPDDPELGKLSNMVKEIVESNEVRRLPKIPKGTRDFGDEQMAIREQTYATIVRVFKRHCASALETPVFELRETLMGKYGEDSKLIYDLADQGGELCSLRYDLTVPFARYLAMNKITSKKRYQIGRVYRRDNPSKGRLREFYQGDFDIAGKYETMEPDFEVVKVLTELLDELKVGPYEIKLNHRKLLDAMLAICGVPAEKFRPVCSSIDKLDKISFEQVKKELVNEKGLCDETAEKIGSFVRKRGPPLQLLAELSCASSGFLENEESVKALKELDFLFRAFEKSRCIDKIIFDLSLARGLDYYTGVIFEAVLTGATQVGSVAAGGRYDNLVKMFGGKDVPAVGVSVGIERVFTIIEEQVVNQDDIKRVIRATETQVLVVLVGKKREELTLLAVELVSDMWGININADFAVTDRVMKQIDKAKQSSIPFMVIIGESELRDKVANLKDVAANREEVIPRDSLLAELERRLNLG